MHDEAPEKRPASTSKRHLGRIALVLGALGAAAFILPSMPRERSVELRLDDARSIVGVDVAWSRDGSDPLRAGSWHFAAGQAPDTLRTAVSLPDGKYELDVTLRRIAGNDSLRRSIELGDAERISVPLR